MICQFFPTEEWCTYDAETRFSGLITDGTACVGGENALLSLSESNKDAVVEVSATRGKSR